MDTERLLFDLAQDKKGDIQAQQRSEVMVYSPFSKKEEPFKLQQLNNFSAELAAKFPEIGSFHGQSLHHPHQKIIINKNGKQLSISYRSSEEQYEMINSNISINNYELQQLGDANVQITCKHDDHHDADFDYRAIFKENARLKNLRAGVATPVNLTKYRIAIATTGQYGQVNGGTVAMSLGRLNNILSKINDMYLKELAIMFELVSENENITFLDPATHPFKSLDIDPLSSIMAFDSMQFLNLINPSRYDIGHTIHYFGAVPIPAGNSFGASGVANLQSACSSNANFKASGFTGYQTTTGFGASNTDNFLAKIVIHEIAHQFGAAHTFNGNGNNCTDGQRGTRIEPGSGSTIMSYFNLCSAGQNLTQPESNYFNIASLVQISNWTTTNKTCGTTTATLNNYPVIRLPANATLPKGTPFSINTMASDPDNHSLTFVWEQFNVGTTNDVGALGQTNGVGGYNATNSTTAPLFRSTSSTSFVINPMNATEKVNQRVFPAITHVLNNGNIPPDNVGEALPNVGRNITFIALARDNQVIGGGTSIEDIVLTVDGTKGPLAVTFPNTNMPWAKAAPFMVQWAVNGTQSISPTVNIWLSTDSGANFNVLLAANTSNDGAEAITLPSTVALNTTSRIKIESTNNPDIVFFDVSNVNFSIVANCPATPVLISTGSGAWENTASWYCNQLPTATNQIKILAGHVLQLNTNAIITSLENAGNIRLNNGSILTVSN